jgi:hypothetical protein
VHVAQVREPRGAASAAEGTRKAPEQRRAHLDVSALITLLDADHIHHVRGATRPSEDTVAG